MATYSHQPAAVGEFRHELFSCLGSVTDCIFASCCPMCYAFVTAQEAGESNLFAIANCICYPWLLCLLRSNVRNKRGIEGDILSDALISYCCPCCATVQMRREFMD